jgi:hypothetical protein
MMRLLPGFKNNFFDLQSILISFYIEGKMVMYTTKNDFVLSWSCSLIFLTSDARVSQLTSQSRHLSIITLQRVFS